MLVFLDMDGVVADFMKGIRKVFKLPDDWWPREYDSMSSELDLTEERFWAAVRREQGFWSNLEPIKEGVMMAGRLNKGGAEIVFATSPDMNPDCARQKMEWIAKTFPHLQRSFCISPMKHFLSAPGRILIDDSIKNCERWELYGGVAFLVLQPYNREHDRSRAYFEIVEEVETFL